MQNKHDVYMLFDEETSILTGNQTESTILNDSVNTSNKFSDDTAKYQQFLEFLKDEKEDENFSKSELIT